MNDGKSDVLGITAEELMSMLEREDGISEETGDGILDLNEDEKSEEELVDSAISSNRVLANYFNMKHQVTELTRRMKDMEPDVIEEFQKVFGSRKSVTGTKVEITLSDGPTKWKFSEAVLQLEQEVKLKKKEEKKSGRAQAIPSDSKVIKTKFL